MVIKFSYVIESSCDLLFISLEIHLSVSVHIDQHRLVRTVTCLLRRLLLAFRYFEVLFLLSILEHIFVNNKVEREREKKTNRRD